MDQPDRSPWLPDLLAPLSALIRKAAAPELFLTDPHGRGIEKLVAAAEDYLGVPGSEEPSEIVELRRACVQYRQLRRREALRILGEHP